MKNNIISLVFILTAAWLTQASAQDAQNLRPDAPDRYTVQRGDTLWGISGRYLDKPWNWPQLWNMNRDQVRNPHRIYPGDVLVLDRASGQLRIDRGDTVRLSPTVRTEEMTQAVPTIPLSAINAFLSKPMVVSENELDAAPRIMATQENRLAVAKGEIAYVKNLPAQVDFWQIYRRGDKMIDPETGETLGYQATYLGDARVRKRGEVSSIEITDSKQDIYTDDRLLPAPKAVPTFAFVPRAPNSSISGRIVSMHDNMFETGKHFIVSLSKGAKDGLEVGHVLALYRSQNTARYSLRTSPMFGRSGPSGSDAPRTYYEERLIPRDGPLYATTAPVDDSELAKIPGERYGLVMIFRTFDRASYGIVMQADLPVAIADIVKSPN